MHKIHIFDRLRVTVPLRVPGQSETAVVPPVIKIKGSALPVIRHLNLEKSGVAAVGPLKISKMCAPDGARCSMKFMKNVSIANI